MKSLTPEADKANQGLPKASEPVEGPGTRKMMVKNKSTCSMALLSTQGTIPDPRTAATHQVFSLTIQSPDLYKELYWRAPFSFP